MLQLHSATKAAHHKKALFHFCLLYLFYFGILSIFIALIDRSYKGLDEFSHLLTLDQLSARFKVNDVGYFATAAIDISKSGWISASNAWILNLWPPGFILVQVFISKAFGYEAPIPLLLQALACFQYSAVLLLVNLLARKVIRSRVLAVAYPLLFFVPEVSRNFLLGPIGVLHGESLALGFFLLGFLIILLFSVNSQRIILDLAGGALIGLSAYFRSNFEIYTTTLSLMGVFLVTSSLLCKRMDLVVCSHLRRVILVTIIACFLVMAPWRIYRLATVGHADWVLTSQLVYSNQLRTNSDLLRDNGLWLVEGGANVACRIDSSKCGKTNDPKSKVLEVFFRSPFRWISYKFALAPSYFMAPIVCDTSFSNPGLDCHNSGAGKYYVRISPEFAGMAVSWPRPIFLAAFLFTYIYQAFSLFCCPIRTNMKALALLFWFNTAFVLATFAIMAIVHFEIRYFFAPFIFCVASGMTGMMMIPRWHVKGLNVQTK